MLCSEDDELAPFQIICNFVNRLKNHGADVTLVKWDKSSHVGKLLNLSFLLSQLSSVHILELFIMICMAKYREDDCIL